MFLMYVDESGDTGMAARSTPFFCLSGLVVHELRWQETLNSLIGFRLSLRARYGLKLREEIHASVVLHRPGNLARIPKSVRLRVLRDVLDFEASLTDISVINVVVQKAGTPEGFDVFDFAWSVLIQRFENTLSSRNFPGPQNTDDRGLLIADWTEAARLRATLRRRRRFNPVPNLDQPGSRDLPLTKVIEDPVHRESHHSFFIQAADVNGFFLYQKMQANAYIRRKGARNWFDRLDPVLCKVASRNDPLGIVRL